MIPLVQRLPRAWYVIAIPLAGLRISLSLAFVLLVASEIVVAVREVGYPIQLAQMMYRVDQMFVGSVFLGVLGFSADRLCVLLVQKFYPWYGAEEGNK